jgi:hypothetical protein
VTLGARGSTHILATAVHAARLGARTIAYTWPQVMNPTACDVERAISRHCATIKTSHALAALARFMLHRGAEHYVPVGGTSPVGMLGHIDAGRELAGQIRDGMVPVPETVDTTVTAVRVVPWIAAPPWRIAQLVRMMGRRAVPVRVDHSAYGGAYGKPLAAGRRAIEATELPLDDTYGAKACAVALASAREPVLLWVTFNARALPPD